MRWTSIIGQKPLQQMLQHSIIANRVPQALLLTGSEGYGTVALALAYARTLLCKAPLVSGKSIAPCEECQHCRQSSTLQNPNLRIVASLPPMKDGKGKDDEEHLPDDVIAEISSGLEQLSSDPYYRYRLSDAVAIRIGQVRELKRSLSLSSVQEGRRVVVILNAEEMNAAAANAFLKTLEEPSANTTIILTSARPERLLQTIVSRCQELVVPPLDDADIPAALVARGLLTADEARLTATFAQGDLQRAVDAVDDDMRTIRDAAINMLRTVLRPNNYRNALVELIEESVEARDKERAHVLLVLVSTWLRDAVAVGAGASEHSLLHADQYDALQRFYGAFGTADLPAVITLIEEASRDVNRNVSIPLVLTTTFLQIRSLVATTRHRPTTA